LDTCRYELMSAFSSQTFNKKFPRGRDLANNPTAILVVAAALRDESGRWLMQRRPAHKQHGGLWEFPGGKVEPGETPGAALVRELNEELTITVAPDDLTTSSFASGEGEGGSPAIVILLYTAARWSGVPRAEEGGEVGWFTTAEIAALDRPPLDVALCAQVFGDCQPQAAPLCGAPQARP